MGKYVVKRIAYMLVVLVILSVVMYLIYGMVPSNRAYTDATNEIKALKNVLPKDKIDEKFDELYLMYQRRYGTDTDNKLIRYLRWVGVYPLYDGSFNGLLQGNFGFSYEMQKPVIDVPQKFIDTNAPGEYLVEYTYKTRYGKNSSSVSKNAKIVVNYPRP